LSVSIGLAYGLWIGLYLKKKSFSVKFRLPFENDYVDMGI